MATNAKWYEQTAVCPYCLQSVAEWNEGKTYLIGTGIRLYSAAVLGCWHPSCDKFFRLEPRRTPVRLSLQKAEIAFPVDGVT